MLQRKIVSIFKSDLNTSGPFLSLNGLIYFSYVGREAQFALVENLKIIMWHIILHVGLFCYFLYFH